MVMIDYKDSFEQFLGVLELHMQSWIYPDIYCH